MRDVFVIDAVRMAGARSEVLDRAHPGQLGAFVLNGLLSGFEFGPGEVQDVIFGVTSWDGEGRTYECHRLWPYGFPFSLPAVALASRCVGSQHALSSAAQSIADGRHDLVVAGGIAGRADPARRLEDAEKLAQKWGLRREQLDRYAVGSHRRARSANESHAFSSELLPLHLVQDDQITSLDSCHDSPPPSYSALALLKPWTVGGVLTKGNSSAPCYGSSAVLLASGRAVRHHGLEPLARLMSFSFSHGHSSGLEGTLHATPKALLQAGLRLTDIDLFEVDEVFASEPLVWIKYFDADPSKLNVNGGAIALGDPHGATGARSMTTLVHALRRRRKRYGLQALSERPGEASVTIVEALA